MAINVAKLCEMKYEVRGHFSVTAQVAGLGTTEPRLMSARSELVA